MINILIAEATKLRRSLVLLVAATPPVMVFALGVQEFLQLLEFVVQVVEAILDLVLVESAVVVGRPLRQIDGRVGRDAVAGDVHRKSVPRRAQ